MRWATVRPVLAAAVDVMGAFLLVLGVFEPVTAVTRQEPCPRHIFWAVVRGLWVRLLWAVPPPLSQLVSAHNSTSSLLA